MEKKNQFKSNHYSILGKKYTEHNHSGPTTNFHFCLLCKLLSARMGLNSVQCVLHRAMNGLERLWSEGNVIGKVWSVWGVWGVKSGAYCV